MEQTVFALWQRLCQSPYHFPMDQAVWDASMFHDVDSAGHLLFQNLQIKHTAHGFIQYGTTALGFDYNGELSDRVHYKVIRMLHFSSDHPEEGQQLLDAAINAFGTGDRIYAFYHYFGMTACARHGKLHESEAHVEKLLLRNGFLVEHENVYYAKRLSTPETPKIPLDLQWKPKNAGYCREFAAVYAGQEIGWGQVHFLPQKDIAYLRWIYIDEKVQHQGFGTAIIQCLFRELYNAGIVRFDTDTAANNLAAQAYYEKTGFTRCGITRSYYTK